MDNECLSLKFYFLKISSERSYSDEYSGSELSTQRSDRTPSPSTKKKKKKKSKVKLKDGSVLDLTPPEDLLPEAEKKARRHMKYEEVKAYNR